VVADDWKAMLAGVKEIEQNIEKDLNAFGGNTLKEINDRVFGLKKQADKSLALLMETKADVQARPPFN
jgi:hypothetical protein